MNQAINNNAADIQHPSFDPSALTNIYDASTNIAIWDRLLDDSLRQFSKLMCHRHQSYQMRVTGNTSAIEQYLLKDLPDIHYKANFIDDVILLADMFGELLDIKTVGVRLAVLTKAMCPKFHVDRVPARLITTYYGGGTEWVPNHYVTRDPQGRVSVNGAVPIESLCSGQVALIKGEIWHGNERKGLVHRSPAITADEPRLVLTIDCV